MKKLFYLSFLILSFAFPITVFAGNSDTQNRQSYKIYVDKNGVMRRDDTKEEVSYYGTNYTLPFAHAYRAVGNLGIDRKKAIDRDVYHLKRLGFNGFRLHLWDVELADSAGNLIQNDHLDLLDYLIAQLEKEGIDILLTAQTNFGNGYPEKNIDTGSYSYDFGKCEIHSDKKAQEIQANYLQQLASHVNPYTGRSYAGDNAIIAMEINNEPCHTDSKKEVTAYINKMVKALKKGGFDKPILYNVSHNPDVTEAYYEADIQGTTYQWYPTGLVAGHQRKGNFLPYVDEYTIPWKDSMKNYDKLARVVYEFDPGDVLYSYLYPAIARSFRKEGFQWITQFAYDPTDIAKYNTEYQTHFLNLAYTPSKTVSMLVAAEAARNIPRGADFGIFPNDTTFGDFTVSYIQDLSLYNTPEKFYYSNTTDVKPKDTASLKNIAGVGSSPIVDYSGTGTYFIDEIKPGLWRLEVMPDVVITSDPFEKPSLNKEIAKIFYSERPLTLSLPQLGDSFFYKAIDSGNERAGNASSAQFNVYPGVYLLSTNEAVIEDTLAMETEALNNLKRFVAPGPSVSNSIVNHSPDHYINPEETLEISAEIIGNNEPQEVWVYPDYVSFWNDENPLFPMVKTTGNKYKAQIPKDKLGWNDKMAYNIVVKENDQYFTWPSNTEGTPLDWDFTNYEYYSSSKTRKNEPMVLLSPKTKDKNLEVTMIPEAWNFRFYPELKSPVGSDSYQLRSTPENDGKLIISRYVGDELNNAPFLNDKTVVAVKVWPAVMMEGIENDDAVEIAFTNKNGATYSAPLKRDYLQNPEVKMHTDNPEGALYKIPLSTLQQTLTNVIPSVYPTFVNREVKTGSMAFSPEDIEFVQLIFPTRKGKEIGASIQGIWLE